MSQTVKANVLVIIGPIYVGSVGFASARRLGSGRHTLLASRSVTAMSSAESTFRNEGYLVSSCAVDLSSYDSVKKVAEVASSLGSIDVIILTSGVTPDNAEMVYKFKLLGHANVIQAFLPVVSPGTSLTCLSSMITKIWVEGMFLPSLELQNHLATAPLDRLLRHAEIDLGDGPEALNKACTITKLGNDLRVEAAASDYGRKGARINSVSYGVVMPRPEMAASEGPRSHAARFLVAISALERPGTPEEVVNVLAFLAGRESSWITGIEILVDGGCVSGLRWGVKK